MAKRIDDGGPAFPRPLSKLSPEEVSGEQDGMSLRDWFAGQALAGIAHLYDSPTAPTRDDAAAESAYMLADAMLRARKKVWE